MRTILMMAAMLAAGPALAQEPATKLPAGTTERNGTFEAAGDVDRYTVDLKKGADHAAGAHGGFEADYFTGEIVVKGPGGAVLKREFFDNVNHGGVEWRAATTGRYTVELATHDDPIFSTTYPTAYNLRVGPDCRTGIKTKCNLKAGAPAQQRQTTYSDDSDWFRLREVTAGRNYALTWNGGPAGDLQVRKRDGTVVATVFFGGGQPVTLAFKAPVSELYAVVAAGDSDVVGAYTIRLARR